MPRTFNFSLARSTSIVLTTFALVHRAAAQGYDPGHDPLVQRSINHGEEMRSSFSQGHYDRTNPITTFGAMFSGRMHVPALPPALGEDLTTRGRSGAAARALAEFSRETFFGPYAMLLERHQITDKQENRIAAYRSVREDLIKELKGKFEELADAAPATRRAALIDFAVQQDARLRTLAEEAEEIRRDLASTGAADEFRAGGLWRSNIYFEDSSATFIWLFFSCYFDSGLTTEQRQLLPEIAYEKQLESTKQKQKRSADSRDYFYFYPAAARIRLPANLPSSLTEKIHRFSSDKEKLKSELRDAALLNGDLRIERFISLAQRQAPRFAELGKLAEEIRVELAGFEYPDQPAKPALPADLTERVGNFYARKVEVQRELIRRMVATQEQFPTAKFSIERQGDGLAIKQTGVSPQNAASLTEFNANLARRYTTLARESELLRRDIQRTTEGDPDHKARSVDQIAADFAKAYAVQENWNQYRDYYRAVLEPGLSPAQRELLFDAAVTELEQNARMLHP